MNNNTTIIAIANHKGGVGKTTTTATLGAALAELGKKVAVIDLDAQSNLTLSLTKENPSRSLYGLFAKGIYPEPVAVSDNLHLFPSSINMAAVELMVSNKKGRESVLKDFISKIRKNYDFILIDCPPSLGIVTLNAFVAASCILVPMTAETLPTKGLKMLDSFIQQVKSLYNKSLYIEGILFTRWKSCKLNLEVENAVKRAFGDDVVFSTKIRENITVAEAPLQNIDLLSYDSRCNGSKDYRELCKELTTRIYKNHAS